MSDSSKTTAVVIPKHGGYEVLEVREWPVPELQEDEIKVAVHRCGLNFAELMARVRPPAPRPRLPTPSLTLPPAHSKACTRRRLRRRASSGTSLRGSSKRQRAPSLRSATACLG